MAGEIRENNYNIRGGADGATFVPEITSDGYLIWSNNKGYRNPPPIFVKGVKGDKGDSPYIGSNGNWWVGDFDTGVDATTGISIQYDENNDSMEIGDVEFTPPNGQPLSILNGYTIADTNKVPKTLSILPQTSSESLSILNNRRNGKMFLDINGNATYVTVEQLKQLNTKIVSVDDLSDNRISGLSENDYVLLNKEI